MLSHFSALKSLSNFAGKKFAIVISDQIPSIDIAYTGSMIGFQFGRATPSMVGRDQKIPHDDGKSRTHLGITTRNLPVLNGLNFENMRTLRKKLAGEESLFFTCVTDAVRTCATYAEYAREVERCPESSANYWGIGIFGDEETVNRYTQGLKLYGKQPKIANPNTTTPIKRLIANKADLPKISFVFANDLTGGQLGNTGVILGVTLGKLYGNSIFGPEVKEHGQQSLGLPMVDLSILNGHPASDVMMRKLREALHADSDKLTVVDVTDATSKTRSYEEYLKLAEATKVLETTYQGIGISGPSELVAKYTKNLGSYITSSEEKELKKEEATKQNAAEKAKRWDTKKNPQLPSGAEVTIENGGLTKEEKTAVSSSSFFSDKPKTELTVKLQELFKQANKSANIITSSVLLTFSDQQLAQAQECRGLLFKIGVNHFHSPSIAMAPHIYENRDKEGKRIYEILLSGDNYNRIVEDNKAFDKLLSLDGRLGELFGQANKSAVVKKSTIILTFSDKQLAQECSGLLFKIGVNNSFCQSIARNIFENTDNGKDTYEILLSKDEYNRIVEDNKAFEKLSLSAPQTVPRVYI